MNTTTKSGFAILVLALLVFQPFGKCIARSNTAMPHHCCPAPAGTECTMAGCVYTNTPPDGAAVPSKIGGEQPFLGLVSGGSEDTRVPTYDVVEPESAWFPLNHRFVALHQFLI
jgi:hypothetical protein